MKYRMLRNILTTLLCAVLTFNVSLGQNQETEFFDSTKHFAKGLVFILNDSLGLPDTLFREVKYRHESTTKWNSQQSKWTTKAVFSNVVDPIYPKERIFQIVSIYCLDNIAIENISLDIACRGSDKEFSGMNNVMSALKQYDKPNSDCRYFVSLVLSNSSGQKQNVFFQIY